MPEHEPSPQPIAPSPDAPPPPAAEPLPEPMPEPPPEAAPSALSPPTGDSGWVSRSARKKREPPAAPAERSRPSGGWHRTGEAENVFVSPRAEPGRPWAARPDAGRTAGRNSGGRGGLTALPPRPGSLAGAWGLSARRDPPAGGAHLARRAGAGAAKGDLGLRPSQAQHPPNQNPNPTPLAAPIPTSLAIPSHILDEDDAGAAAPLPPPPCATLALAQKLAQQKAKPPPPRPTPLPPPPPVSNSTGASARAAAQAAAAAAAVPVQIPVSVSVSVSALGERPPAPAADGTPRLFHFSEESPPMGGEAAEMEEAQQFAFAAVAAHAPLPPPPDAAPPVDIAVDIAVEAFDAPAAAPQPPQVGPADEETLDDGLPPVPSASAQAVPAPASPPAAVAPPRWSKPISAALTLRHEPGGRVLSLSLVSISTGWALACRLGGAGGSSLFVWRGPGGDSAELVSVFPCAPPGVDSPPANGGRATEFALSPDGCSLFALPSLLPPSFAGSPCVLALSLPPPPQPSPHPPRISTAPPPARAVLLDAEASSPPWQPSCLAVCRAAYGEQPNPLRPSPVFVFAGGSGGRCLAWSQAGPLAAAGGEHRSERHKLPRAHTRAAVPLSCLVSLSPVLEQRDAPLPTPTPTPTPTPNAPPAATRLAAVCSSGAACVWDLPTRTLLCCLFSPACRFAALCPLALGGAGRIETREEGHRASRRDPTVWALAAISPHLRHGRRDAGEGGEAGEVAYARLRSSSRPEFSADGFSRGAALGGEVLCPPCAARGRTAAAAVRAGATLFSAPGGGAVVLWDVVTGEQTALLSAAGGTGDRGRSVDVVTALAFESAGGADCLFAVGDGGGAVSVFLLDGDGGSGGMPLSDAAAKANAAGRGGGGRQPEDEDG